MMTNDTAGDALAGYILAMFILTGLEQKGLISKGDAKQLLDAALLNLETFQHRGGPDRKPAYEGARQRLESLLALISRE